MQGFKVERKCSRCSQLMAACSLWMDVDKSEMARYLRAVSFAWFRFFSRLKETQRKYFVACWGLLKKFKRRPMALFGGICLRRTLRGLDFMEKSLSLRSAMPLQWDQRLRCTWLNSQRHIRTISIKRALGARNFFFSQDTSHWRIFLSSSDLQNWLAKTHFEVVGAVGVWIT